jgi:hypothetical protein
MVVAQQLARLMTADAKEEFAFSGLIHQQGGGFK